MNQTTNTAHVPLIKVAQRDGINPIVTSEGDKYLIVCAHSRRFILQINVETLPQPKLVCRFLEHRAELYAAVFAPGIDYPQLARRIVSFISAYLPVPDTLTFEQEILRQLQCHSYPPSTPNCGAA